MEIKKLSSKQKQILKWCHKKDGYDAIICDGAVRSGKTVVMGISFIHWAMRYHNRKNFAFMGKTVRSAERNIIAPIMECSDVTAFFKLEYSRSNGILKIRGGGHENTFYLFGGKDESSFALIQGITLTGVMFDEVALMPQSFVEQAIARTLSEKGAKLWFNCNPENPNHWFYREWIMDADGENKKNCLHLHFLMEDNPSLSPEQLQKAKNLYSGVFYERYILGRWVRAEGLIYSGVRGCIAKEKRLPAAEKVMIGVDFGGNRSLTTFVASVIERDFRGVTVIKDMTISGKKGDINSRRLCDSLYRFIMDINNSYNIMPDEIRADSAEQYLINTLRTFLGSKGLNIPVKDSVKGKIIDRIRCTEALMKSGRLKIFDCCGLLINGLENAVWDKDAAQKGLDLRLDDFTSDIDILDAFEYSFSPFLRRLTPEIFKRPHDRKGLISAEDFKGGWS